MTPFFFLVVLVTYRPHANCITPMVHLLRFAGVNCFEEGLSTFEIWSQGKAKVLSV
jgi:hypothetical protein